MSGMDRFLRDAEDEVRGAGCTGQWRVLLPDELRDALGSGEYSCRMSYAMHWAVASTPAG